MLDWINNMSLKKKLYLIFGFMIASSVCGIIIGQITLARVQVGGKIYTDIAREMKAAGDIEKLMLNINLARGRAAALMAEHDQQKKLEHIEVIKAQTSKIDELYRDIESAITESNISDAVSSIAKAKESWNDIKDMRDNKVIPLVLRGALDEARVIAQGPQTEKFMIMSNAAMDADSIVNDHVSKVVEKMKRESKILRWAYICGGGMAIVFLFVVARFFSSTIISPIVMVSHRSRAMAGGDFRASCSAVTRKDEIGLMMKDFNTMSEKIGEVVGHIKSGIMNLSSASEELSSTAEDLSKGSRQQSLKGNDALKAVSEMSQSIIDVARNAGQAADVTKDSSGRAFSGKETVEITVATMLKIADDVKGATDTIKDLDKCAMQIGEIVAVINDIADQTNLLALNAAIEAARAGDQGRGFAIVADEVRKLAEKTARATGDIKQRISSIQAEANKSGEIMRKGSEEVDRGVSIAREASQSLDSIVRSSSDVVEMVQKIAAATEGQSAAAEEIAQNMENISVLINHSAEATEHINQAARNLSHLAVEIQACMDWFNVDGQGRGA
jgi:methyl-accepting chemotaxis protein